MDCEAESACNSNNASMASGIWRIAVCEGVKERTAEIVQSLPYTSDDKWYHNKSSRTY